MRKNNFRNVLFIAFALFISVPAFCQSQLTNSGARPAVLKDSILSIVNLRTQKDSAKIGTTIAIKLRTSIPADSFKTSFNTLYINGLRVQGLTNNMSVKGDDKTVYFTLSKVVRDTLQNYIEHKAIDKIVLPVYLSVGDTSHAVVKAVNPMYIEVKHEINKYWFIGIGLLLIILVVKALANNILRDDNNLYYSLGRVQLFYWTVLFIVAYLYICFTTDSLPDIPGSILAIIGISVATTAASKVIENNSKEKVEIDPAAKSEGMILDILSDGTSINIQRFQNVAFNLVFGIILIQKTIATNLLPDFDDNVLMMLGISSGAYAGLKTTEPLKEQNKPLPESSEKEDAS